MNTGIIGASGYAGGELLRLLSNHPEFETTYISAGSNAGQKITSIHQHLTFFKDQLFEATDTAAMNKCDLLFLALPHGESAKLVKEIDPSIRIVDLGADFRLHSSQSWKKYYGGDHAGTWVYGLPELPGQREKIRNASRIANPGCYATAVSLAAAPAVSAGLVDSSDIVVVASSGTTGAGRTAKVNLLGSEVMNSLTSYKFGGIHQHTPEIEETLSGSENREVKISFTPVLAPMPRGILATVTAKISPSINYEALRPAYEKTYADESFVTLLPEGEMTKTSSVLGSNSVHLQMAFDEHTNRLIVSSAIDNLGKGAASQAIQNANLMMGFAEGASLAAIGIPS